MFSSPFLSSPLPLHLLPVLPVSLVYSLFSFILKSFYWTLESRGSVVIMSAGDKSIVYVLIRFQVLADRSVTNKPWWCSKRSKRKFKNVKNALVSHEYKNLKR